MTTALLLSQAPDGPQRLVHDLTHGGIQVLGVLDALPELMHQVVQSAPDVVIVEWPEPDDALFECTQALATMAPVPVLLFTDDSRTSAMERAVESGIHVYGVHGHDATRLEPLVRLAQVRWRHEQAGKRALQELSQRLDERKAVERAKGLLMQARQLSDDEAFRILRTVSMHANLRLGQVSQQILHSAHFAEAVNRAGQLRMLSQRLVKLYLLRVAEVQADAASRALADSLQRIELNLEWLSKKLTAPEAAGMLAPVLAQWSRLHTLLQRQARADLALDVDALAQQLLDAAESLTESLRRQGAVPTLQVLNIAGRQRMLSQRYVKYALLTLIGAQDMVPQAAALQAATQQAFAAGLDHLRAAPLSTPDIRQMLDRAQDTWRQMVELASCSHEAATPAVLRERWERLFQGSESLLDALEQLFARYEHSLDLLLG